MTTTNTSATTSTTSNINYSTILSNQEETTKQINNLLTQSAAALSCGPECQKQQKIKELRQYYINAQTTAETAPHILSEAEKNYYTYTQGIAGYNKRLTSELDVKANKLADVMFQQFTSHVENAIRLTDTYDSLSNNYGYMQELELGYLKKIKTLKQNIQGVHSDIITDDRKTYYESQTLDVLYRWNTIWKIIYIVLLVIIIFTAYVKKMSFLKIGVLFLVLCIYPFLAKPLVQFIARQLGLWIDNNRAISISS